jgi:anti-anti-sigma factor
MSSPPRTEPFDLKVHDRDGTRAVVPQGALDLSSVPVVREPLTAGIRDGFETVVLDLGETTFLDSIGMKLILDVTRMAEEEGVRLIVLPGPPHVQQTFEMSGLLEAAHFTGLDSVDTPVA